MPLIWTSPPGGTRGFDERFGIAVIEDDMGAGRRRRGGVAEAKASCGSGNEDDLAVKREAVGVRLV